jgi:hypothetical protein
MRPGSIRPKPLPPAHWLNKAPTFGRQAGVHSKLTSGIHTDIKRSRHQISGWCGWIMDMCESLGRSRRGQQ